MLRKSRIEIASFYHIINRGIDQRDVFTEDKNFKKFINLFC